MRMDTSCNLKRRKVLKLKICNYIIILMAVPFVVEGLPNSLKSTSSLPPESCNGHDGYELSIFVKKPTHYICPVCDKVLRSPRQLQCGDRFCKNCVEKILQKSEEPVCPVVDCQETVDVNEIVPDHAVRKDILALDIYCEYRDNGCNKIIKLRDLSSHIQECGYAEIDCIHKQRGCHAKVERRHLADHLASDCLYSPVTCEYCNQSLSREDLEEHVRRCPQAPVSCPNGCGVKDIPRMKVTLVLLDQATGRRNLSDTFRPDPTSSSFKQPTGDMNVASGCPLFVSQSVLETPTYIKNDTLYIKVVVDTSDLYGP
ncbi:TNF receptor-associated factor 5-like [Saccoglossus kowalevskii]|uniref:TNF receptor-associated factor 3-like n=1 Tax=Saccoglossus kowalevskii TaxID=10224 RepID=A0ABM0MK82_SACKO|nr:PREDICTED: TNF receptor-associated factor 3-like [Saccoglossus kowalevskii]